MQKTLTCACGAVLVARSEEDLLTAVEQHLDESHDVFAHGGCANRADPDGADKRVAAPPGGRAQQPRHRSEDSMNRTLPVGLVLAALAVMTTPAAAQTQARFYTYYLVSANLKITQKVSATYNGGAGYEKNGTVVFHGVRHGRQQTGALQIDKRFGNVVALTDGTASWTGKEWGPGGTRDCSGSSKLPGYGGIGATLLVRGRAVRALWPISVDGSDPICGLAITFNNVIDRETVPLSVFRRRTVLLTFKGKDLQTNQLAAGTETQQLEWTGAVKLHRLEAF